MSALEEGVGSILVSVFAWDLLKSSGGLVDLTLRVSVVSSSLDDVIDEVVGKELNDVAELVVLKVVVDSMEGFKDGDEDSNI